jgi:hypothetical protein
MKAPLISAFVKLKVENDGTFFVVPGYEPTDAYSGTLPAPVSVFVYPEETSVKVADVAVGVSDADTEMRLSGLTEVSGSVPFPLISTYAEYVALPLAHPSRTTGALDPPLVFSMRTPKVTFNLALVHVSVGTRNWAAAVSGGIVAE